MKIIDTTIRDGSYAVDFKFSCKDVKDLVEKSRRIGIEYIEIGHGQGLNASSDEHGFSLQSDEEYMDAAREVAGDCKLGMFCIPGIARIDDVRKAKEHGMDFLRIGVTVQGFNEARPFIDQCKSEGLEVFVNFMKTPTALPKEFGEASANAYKSGARCVYIVDSAGSMSESDIGKYITAAREKSDVELGFHGHNNMGLAVGNTIYCITEGMEFVDCTFQGLGRSLGNAPLEQVVMLLERKGYLSREKGGDRRGNMLRITEAGRQAIPQDGDGDEAYFVTLTSRQRQQLANTLRQLLNDWIDKMP